MGSNSRNYINSKTTSTSGTYFHVQKRSLGIYPTTSAIAALDLQRNSCFFRSVWPRRNCGGIAWSSHNLLPQSSPSLSTNHTQILSLNLFYWTIDSSHSHVHILTRSNMTTSIDHIWNPNFTNICYGKLKGIFVSWYFISSLSIMQLIWTKG